MCLIYIKQEKWDRVVKFCSDILASDDKNVKALYRMGLAKLKQNDVIGAEKYSKMALELEPQNKELQGLAKEILLKESEGNKEMKANLSKMFK